MELREEDRGLLNLKIELYMKSNKKDYCFGSGIILVKSMTWAYKWV